MEPLGWAPIQYGWYPTKRKLNIQRDTTNMHKGKAM